MVVTLLAEWGLSRSPLLESALTEVCSDIPGAIASSLIARGKFLVKAGSIPQRTHILQLHLMFNQLLVISAQVIGGPHLEKYCFDPYSGSHD